MQRLMFDGEAHDRMSEACSAVGAPPGVVKTLIHLDPDRPVAMRDVAAHFSVDASYVTWLVDELESRGLARRLPHPTDRRVKTVALTAAGAEVRRQVHDLMASPPSCFAALTAVELRDLRALLGRLVAADARLSDFVAPLR